MGYSTSTLSGVASYDQYSYETFAGFTAPYDLSFLKSPGGEVTSSYPSSQVMQNDVLDNGANQFDLFNGLNGWDFPYLVSESYGCGSVFMTLFNGTPNTLSLYAEPTGGSITSGSLLGNVQVSAQNGVYMRLQGDMQPYSYTPIVASVNSLSNSAVSITVQVFDPNYSTQASVASLTFGGKSTLPGGPLVVDATNVNWIDGYSWSPMPANNAYASTGSNIKQPSSASSCGSLSSNSPGGLWATIVQ